MYEVNTNDQKLEPIQKIALIKNVVVDINVNWLTVRQSSKRPHKIYKSKNDLLVSLNEINAKL